MRTAVGFNSGFPLRHSFTSCVFRFLKCACGASMLTINSGRARLGIETPLKAPTMLEHKYMYENAQTVEHT